MAMLCCLDLNINKKTPKPARRLSQASSRSQNSTKSCASSVYKIEVSDEMDDAKTRNAAQLRLQLMLTEELSKDTYGLEVDKSNSTQYEAQDFFIFKEILGSGATAVVFRAVFRPTGHPLAVKFIPNFKSAKTMMMRELKVLKIANNCRFLIDFHSHFRVGPNLYFVMEICEGGTLEELIQPKHHLPARLMKIYLKEISSALFYLHSLKIVHRDVAPPNMFIDTTGHLKLGDFGLCRIVDDPQGELMTDCGKPYIKAPEMYMDKPCTFAIDWWSVGIIIYRVISGYFPFKTDKLTQGYQNVTKCNEKYPEWAFTDVDAKNLCQGFLAKKPRDRLGSENEIATIKSHPYFLDVDWNIKEDIVEISNDIIINTEDPSVVTVLTRVLAACGVKPPPQVMAATSRKSMMYFPGQNRKSMMYFKSPTNLQSPGTGLGASLAASIKPDLPNLARRPSQILGQVAASFNFNVPKVDVRPKDNNKQLTVTETQV